jgi:glycosyltransferase involved in cell wall biosynthesis
MTFLQLSLQKFGGGAIDALEFSEALRTTGIKHEVIINAENELNDRWQSLPERPVHRVFTYASSITSFIWHTCLFWRVIKSLHLIKHIQPSVVYATHFHPWLFFVILLKIFLRFKFIYVVHENPFIPKENTNFLFLWLEKYCIRHADILIAHSNFVHKELTSYVQVPIFTLPLGAYHHYFLHFKKHLSSDNKLRLLFLGRIEPYKGLEILVDAFTLLKEKQVLIELTIAGKGKLFSELEKKCIALGIVIHNQWIGVEEMSSLVGAADVLVLPYIQASQSGVISIALGYGIPVIASRVGGMVEQIHEGETGFLFEPGNALDLVKKIEQLLVDRQLVEKMGTQALELGKGPLSWEEGVEQLVKNLRSQKIII